MPVEIDRVNMNRTSSTGAERICGIFQRQPPQRAPCHHVLHALLEARVMPGNAASTGNLTGSILPSSLEERSILTLDLRTDPRLTKELTH